MTRKRRRMLALLAFGLGLGGATALTLSAMSSSLVFFVSPTSLLDHAPRPGQTVRLGGLVQAGSLVKSVGPGEPVTSFRVTDGKHSVEVRYRGVLPDLFRVGQGVVVMGTFNPGQGFHAEEVLAKHDENYMPKDVVAALKKSGEWNPASGKPVPAGAAWDGVAGAKGG